MLRKVLARVKCETHVDIIGSEEDTFQGSEESNSAGGEGLGEWWSGAEAR